MKFYVHYSTDCMDCLETEASVVDINTLEDLISFCDKYSENTATWGGIIIKKYDRNPEYNGEISHKIEIYNYWRE